MKAKNNQEWNFFCHMKCMSEKRIAYRVLKKALFILTGKKFSKIPENHIMLDILGDLEYHANSLLCAAHPNEAIKIYKNILNNTCENVKGEINKLIVQ